MARNLQPTKMNMFSQFIKRIKKNIHMVIAMSPLGEVFRNRLRMFPSLVNCSTIDWFTEWPEDALIEVGKGSIAQEGDLGLGDQENACVEMFKIMHKDVEKSSARFLDELRRHNYVTPTSYLELLAMYKDILQSKRKEILFQKNRLAQGLRVLAEAQVEIDKLKIMLDQKRPDLEKTQEEVEKTKIILQKDKAEADEERKTVSAEEEEATQQEQEANTLMDEAQTELSKAAPLLEEATKILNSLDQGDFYVLNTIVSPTPTVVLGMELSCIMMGIKPRKNIPKRAPNDTHGYFDAAKSNLLSQPKKFMADMVNYKKDQIPESTVKRVNLILNSEEFAYEKVKNASGALVAIQKWSGAMMKYHELLKIVKPKQAKVAEMKEKLKIVRANLAEKRQRLKEVEEKIEELERMFREKVAQEEALLKEIDDCNKKLERAGKLISGLEGEKVRWTETVKLYEAEYGLLIGNCLVASGMIAYSGPFTS